MPKKEANNKKSNSKKTNNEKYTKKNFGNGVMNNIFIPIKSILEVFSWDWKIIARNIIIAIVFVASVPFSFFSDEQYKDKSFFKNNKKVAEEIYSKEQIATILSNEDILSEQINVPECVSEPNSYDADEILSADMQNTIIPEGWLFFEIPSNVRNENEFDKIAAYSDFYKQIIEEKVKCIDNNEKITQEYIKYVLEANDRFSKYDKQLDNEMKISIIENAIDLRLEAKNECRQTSNEQILANWYAMCGANSFENNYADKEFTYYNYAIDMYLNGYCVSLVKYEEPKIISLDYIMTCFLNIYNNFKLSDEIRIDALYSAAAFDLMYKEQLEHYNKSESMTKEEHGMHMDLGEIYIGLCKNAHPIYKLYYYQLAYDELILCPQYAYFGKRLATRVYNDLIYLTQYCYDNVNAEYYQGTFTKNDMYNKHMEFQSKLEEYIN